MHLCMRMSPLVLLTLITLRVGWVLGITGRAVSPAVSSSTALGVARIGVVEFGLGALVFTGIAVLWVLARTVAGEISLAREFGRARRAHLTEQARRRCARGRG